MTYHDDKGNPFETGEGADSVDIDAAIYGKVDAPESGRVVARPIAIMEIYADPKQPRRAIPALVREGWAFTPEEVGETLNKWIIMAGEMAGDAIDIVGLLTRGGEGVDAPAESGQQVYAELLELIRLAASIRHDGLQSPISVARFGTKYIIESGERRLLAHHLLRLYVGDKYAQIPAVVKDRVDVWKQAAENGARRPLNAVGMARQLALLIMDMYAGDADARIDEYETLILPGECDRAFYAQVKNGNVYRVKRGMGQRILDVTGLKSKSQINQYRDLLAVPDDLWTKADQENWTEYAIRTAMDEVRETNRAGLRQTEIEPQMGDRSPARRPIAPKIGDFETIHTPQHHLHPDFANEIQTPTAEDDAPWSRDVVTRLEAEDDWRGDDEGETVSDAPLVMDYPRAHALLSRVATRQDVNEEERLAAETLLKLTAWELQTAAEDDAAWAKDVITRNSEIALNAEIGEFLTFIDACQQVIDEID
jgi:hypothetical protein